MSPLKIGRASASWAGGITLAVAALVVGPLLHPISGAMVGARDFRPCRIEGAAFPKRIVDPSGRTRVLAAPPRRIVSSYLAADEILAALVEPDRVAAASLYADDPSSSNCVGAFPAPVARVRGEPEEVLALRPDLVFVTSFTDEGTVRLLDNAGVALVRFSDWDSFAGVLAHIRLIGAAVGAEARAETLVQSVEQRLASVEARVRGRPRPRVLYYEPPGYTRGAGALIDEMIDRAGGANVAREMGITGVAEIGFESVLALRPEVVVIPGFTASREVPAALAHAGGWSELPAVRAHRVYVVPASVVTAISHHAAHGVEVLARVLHPESGGAPGARRD